jgi:hypothetical protein
MADKCDRPEVLTRNIETENQERSEEKPSTREIESKSRQ